MFEGLTYKVNGAFMHTKTECCALVSGCYDVCYQLELLSNTLINITTAGSQALA